MSYDNGSFRNIVFLTDRPAGRNKIPKWQRRLDMNFENKVTSVLPREVPPLPHVGSAAAACDLCCAFLEGVRLSGPVHVGQRRLIEETAQVEEVLLAA